MKPDPSNADWLHDELESVRRQYTRSGLFARPPERGKRWAVVSVDLALAWTDPRYPPYCEGIDRAVENTAELLGWARRREVPVVHCTGARARVGDRRYSDSEQGFQLDEHAFTIDPRVRPAPGEAVFVKDCPSAFTNLGVVAHLVGLGVDSLLVAGCTTGSCIRATAGDATNLGFHAFVVRECVADRAEILHRVALFEIETRVAAVLSLDEIRKWPG